MESHIEQLKSLIDGAQKILITSHISPDPDALSSLLLLGTTLEANFPDKKIKMILEEKSTKDLSFLIDYSEIRFGPLADEVKEFKPDLIVIVDAMNFERCSRHDGTKVRELTQQLNAKTVVIDHHEKLDVESEALHFNKQNPSTSQELYELLFDELGLKKPESYAQTALLGMITDSARFKYENPRHRETFKIVSDLIDAGASIEQLENKTDRYTTQQMKAISTLAANIKDSAQGYTYSFMDDSIFDQPVSRDDKISALKTAAEVFTNKFARNFERNNWGFIVYPELASGPDVYAVSFRSVTDSVDVAALAHKLGGGGHKQAAGAKIQAKNVEEALQKVQAAIQKTKN